MNYDDIFVKGQSHKYNGQGKFNMTWRLIQSNGFKQAKELKKRN
jgi:hypothetical protein